MNGNSDYVPGRGRPFAERRRKIEGQIEAASRAMNEVLNTICEDGGDSPTLRQLTAEWHATASRLISALACRAAQREAANGIEVHDV